MTTVLIVDPNEETRQALECRLTESNQFACVLSCSNLQQADALLAGDPPVSVVLLDASQTSPASELQRIKQQHPDLGVVLIQDSTGVLDSATLHALGGHAQASKRAAPMELIASVAKALVARLKPNTGLLGKLLKDSPRKS